jgi:hypothetical protein
MHAVCKNPEEHIIWRTVTGNSALFLARYTYGELEDAGTSCAKKCAVEAQCVAFEQVSYDFLDHEKYEQKCAPAQIQTAQAPCIFARIPVAAARFLSAGAAHQWC